MGFMFQGCSSLKSISDFDTSNNTNFEGMFDNCSNLISAELDTSKLKKIQYMFRYCHNLERLCELNAANNTSSLSSTYSPIYQCYALRDFGGFKDINVNFYIDTAFSLTYESLINILNGLKDGANKTIYMRQDQVNQFSDDDIAIATNKGWSISPAKNITEPIVVTQLSQIPSSTYLITPRNYDFSQFTGE